MKQKPAVFLDRDGVLTEENGYITSSVDLVIFPYTKACIQRIHRAGYLAIVITNQSAVGRGMVSETALCQMHEYLKQSIGVDAIYYCPHWHDPRNTRTQYNVDCNCRKPKKGLIERALRDYPIQLAGSYFVGDRASDILTGNTLGITTVLLESGYGSKRLETEVTPDHIYGDLKGFVENLF